MPRAPIHLAECTTVEVADALERSPKVIVPIGATEQHGPHAPYGTDTILAGEVARRIASRIDALVAPPLPYGASADHLGFPGVPYISGRTLASVLRDVCASLAAGGFREIIVVNGHSTNTIAFPGAIAEIGGSLPRGTILFGFSYWDALAEHDLRTYLGTDVGWHANIGETSAVMAIHPELVRLERAEPEYPQFPVEPTRSLLSAFYFSGPGTMFRTTRSGVWGDPRSSSPEQGRAYLEQLEEAGVRFIENVEKMFREFGPSSPARERARE